MKRTKHGWVWPVLIAATLAFIWGNSLLPAAASSAFSGWVRALISALTGSVTGGSGAEIGIGLLRKLAHLTEFTCLGAEMVCWQRARLPRVLPNVLLSGLLVALIDETIQLFSPGRGSEVRDVWIDLAGFVCGVGMVLLALYWHRKRKGTGKK